MIEREFDFGDLVRDRVTGFEGIVLIVKEYATGSLQYGLQAQKLCGGVPPDYIWFEDNRLSIVTSGAVQFKNVKSLR